MILRPGWNIGSHEVSPSYHLHGIDRRARQTLELFDISCQYDIKPLILLLLNKCIRSISRRNIKDYLQTANLHANTKLKKACFEFIQRRQAEVLMRPEMMAMATENPELWGEMGSYLTKPKKKARTANMDASRACILTSRAG
jgi:hypothetical protein